MVAAARVAVIMGFLPEGCERILRSEWEAQLDAAPPTRCLAVASASGASPAPFASPNANLSDRCDREQRCRTELGHRGEQLDECVAHRSFLLSAPAAS